MPSPRPLWPDHPSTSGTLILAAIAAFAMLSASGCRIIWEPAEDAVERVLDPIAARDHLDDLVEDPEIRSQVKILNMAFTTALYKGRSNYWTIDEVEEDEAENRTYVWVTVLVPGRSESRDEEYELVFEMERVWLNWKIHYIDGIDELADAVKRAR